MCYVLFKINKNVEWYCINANASEKVHVELLFLPNYVSQLSLCKQLFDENTVSWSLLRHNNRHDLLSISYVSGALFQVVYKFTVTFIIIIATTVCWD